MLNRILNFGIKCFYGVQMSKILDFGPSLGCFKNNADAFGLNAGYRLILWPPKIENVTKMLGSSLGYIQYNVVGDF